jgi:hypothetical protein
MRRPRLSLASMFLASAIALPLAGIGCAGHGYIRVHDPYYRDYHRWSPAEDRHYRRWEDEGRKDHREWKERRSEEQKEYWGWRHSHTDHDRDKR